jgi:hypothetical protein
MEMFRILVAACFFAVPLSAMAGPAEDSLFATFEALCLQQLSKPDITAQMIEKIGGMAVSQAEAKDLMQQPGRVWLVPDEHRIAIMLSDEGACSAYGPDIADHDGVIAVFVQNTRNRELTKEPLGSEMEHIYAVTEPSEKGSLDMHALVILRYSNLASVPGFFLTSIPEAVAKQSGLTLPTWP